MLKWQCINIINQNNQVTYIKNMFTQEEAEKKEMEEQMAGWKTEDAGNSVTNESEIGPAEPVIASPKCLQTNTQRLNEKVS